MPPFSGTTSAHPSEPNPPQPARIRLTPADDHWARYNARQTDRDVRETCRRAMSLAGPGAGRTAVDLGCGAGRETRALLDAGWQVAAYDGEPTMLAAVNRADPALTAHPLRFEEITELPPADLIHAAYALPFQERPQFDRLWTLIRSTLRPGGRVAVDLFGVRDSWAGNPGLTFVTAAEARSLVDGLTVEHWHEQDEPGPAFSGPKHWHVFELIARRPL
jgi:SAM-dependent methyltransferase